MPWTASSARPLTRALHARTGSGYRADHAAGGAGASDRCRTVLPVARAADRGRGNSHGPHSLRHSACAHPQGGLLRLPLGPRGPVRASCLASCIRCVERLRIRSGLFERSKDRCRLGRIQEGRPCRGQPSIPEQRREPRIRIILTWVGATCITVPPVARAVDHRPYCAVRGRRNSHGPRVLRPYTRSVTR